MLTSYHGIFFAFSSICIATVKAEISISRSWTQKYYCVNPKTPFGDHLIF